MGPSVIAASTTQFNVLGQFDLRLAPGRRTDLLAGHRVPAHATAAGAVRRRAGHRDLAAALAPGGGRQPARVPHRARARHAAGVPADHSLHRGPGACWPSPSSRCSISTVVSTPIRPGEAAGALRFYAIGLAGYAALKVLVNAFYALDQRRTPDVRQLLRGGAQSAAQLDIHPPARLGPSGSGVLDRLRRDLQFHRPVPAHAPASETPRNPAPVRPWCSRWRSPARPWAWFAGAQSAGCLQDWAQMAFPVRLAGCC